MPEPMLSELTAGNAGISGCVVTSEMHFLCDDFQLQQIRATVRAIAVTEQSLISDFRSPCAKVPQPMPTIHCRMITVHRQAIAVYGK
jgi:hypothetical protein